MRTQPKLASAIEDSTIAVDLGDAGFDRVTGFRGVVTSISLFDHTGPRVLLEALADGEVHSEWLDAGRVKLDELPAGVGG